MYTWGIGILVAGLALFPRNAGWKGGVGVNDYYVIHSTDINRPSIRAFGRVWPVSNFMGRVLPQDVGKRVFLRGGILQVENDEQHSRREGTL